MRKFIFAILLLYNISSIDNIINAQTRRNEFRVGVGIFSTSQFIDAFSDIIISSVPTGAFVTNASSIGAWHAGYKYILTDRWAVGGVFVFDCERADALRSNSNETGEKIGDFNRYHYTFSAEAEFSYFTRERFRFYSSVGLGGTLYHQTYKALNETNTDSYNIFHFNFQVTPIALKYGYAWGSFLELGFGYKGIMNIGVFYSL